MSHLNAVVLVVEDDPIIRMCAVDIIAEAGLDTIEAACADDAIKILEARPDVRLVFTDIEMPGTMDGIKLSHYIRERWPPIKLIVASGKAIVEESHLPTGARFFSKPYSDRTIVDEIRKMLSDAAPGAYTSN